MIEGAFAQTAIRLVLLALVSLLIPASYRIIVGETLPDRLQAMDLITTLLIGIIAMLALVEETEVFVDMAIALAAFAFIGTISIAREIFRKAGSSKWCLNYSALRLCYLDCSSARLACWASYACRIASPDCTLPVKWRPWVSSACLWARPY